MGIAGFQAHRQTYVWADDISLWQHQLKYYPQEPIALNGLVAALRNQDEFIQAEQEYQKMIGMANSGDTVEYSQYAKENIARVQYLVNTLMRAHAIAPDYVDIPYKLGNLFKDVGLYADAILYYKKAIDIDLSYKKVYLSLADLYFEIGDVERSNFALNQYLKVQPIKKEDFINAVLAYSRYLDYADRQEYRFARKEALHLYVAYINSKPADAKSFFNLGVMYSEVGDSKSAISAYERAIALNSSYLAAYYNLGNIYRDLQQWDAALSYYNKAISMDSGHSEAYLNIGNVLVRQRKLDLAEEYYKKAIKADLNNDRAYFNLAFVYEKQSKLRLALQNYKESININIKNSEAYYNLGNVYLELQKPDEAISSYLKVVELDSNHQDAWVNLAITTFNEHQYQNALRYYDEALLLGYEPPQHFQVAIENIRTK